MTDAQWFAEGKQLLLVQINAADQTKRVGNMLSGILKRDETEKQAPATTPDAASLSPAIRSSAAGRGVAGKTEAVVPLH